MLSELEWVSPLGQTKWGRASADSSIVPMAESLKLADGVSITALCAAEALGSTVIFAGDSSGIIYACLPSGETDGATHVAAAQFKAQHGPIAVIETSCTSSMRAAGEDFTIAVTGQRTPHATCVKFSDLSQAGVAPLVQRKRPRHPVGKRGAGASPSVAPAQYDGPVVFLKGHLLQITDVAFQMARSLLAYTASLDGTVRGFNTHSGECQCVIPMPNRIPALCLGFDRSGFQHDGFVVGGIGECVFVDLVPASRPGFSTNDRPNKPEGRPDHDVSQVPVARALEMPPLGTDDAAAEGATWYTAVDWCAESSELQVLRAFVPAGTSTNSATVQCQRITRSPAIAPMVVGEVTSTASMSFGQVRSRPSRVATALSRPPAIGMPCGALVWPPRDVVESVTQAAQDIVEQGAPAEIDSDDEFAGDEELLQLRKEREELRRMCADLMQKRKALRAEMRVTA